MYAFVSLFIAACQKEEVKNEEAEEFSNITDEANITKQILNFKTLLNSGNKSTGTCLFNYAVELLEGVYNYTYGFTNLKYRNYQF